LRGTIEKRFPAGALALVLSLGVWAGGCARSEPTPGVQESEGVSSDLVATMQVEPAAGEVGLTLHVTNTTSAPIELEFSSGQRFDFTVTRLDGESLWTWSADKSFMAALGQETVPAGGSLRYEAEWPSQGLRGEFVATGTLTSTNRRVAQSVRFELAGDE